MISKLSDQDKLEDYFNPDFVKITRTPRLNLEEVVKKTSIRQSIAWSR
ncbi:MAG: hypothetical protein QXL52_01555 [Nitrososphaerales archaeon]